jgi:hypothetical protein
MTRPNDGTEDFDERCSMTEACECEACECEACECEACECEACECEACGGDASRRRHDPPVCEINPDLACGECRSCLIRTREKLLRRLSSPTRKDVGHE